MGTENNNPFVLPGFGQTGDAAQNPLMASMDMMRRAWQGMAGATGMETAAMAAPMSVEDLERRISELRVVENWLRMNLSMLSSTIQGMEVQRSTISTLMSFAASASHVTGATSAGGGDAAASPSPLEVVLGIKPAAPDSAGTSDIENQHTSTASTAQAAMESAAAAAQERAEHAAQAATAYAASAETAVKGWWDMLQKQFDTLATATAASMPNTEAASGDSTLGKKPVAKAARKASKVSKAAAEKPVAKKAPAKPVTKKPTKAKKTAVKVSRKRATGGKA